MAKPILIAKDTLQEILEKYQGGGSSGGGVESNIVDVCFAADHTSSQNTGDLHIYALKSDYEKWLRDNNTTESEILSTFNNLTAIEQYGFFTTYIGLDFNEIPSLYQGVRLEDEQNIRPAFNLITSVSADENDNIVETHVSVSFFRRDGTFDGASISYYKASVSANNPATLSISTLDLVTGSSQGGDGSSVGGSGKLYELQFSLELYDENGNQVDYVSSPLSNPKFICTISENNFERFKQFVNAFSQQHGSSISISTINDVVSVINSFNKTQGWQDNAMAPDTYYGNTEYTMLSFLFAFADKTLLRVEIPTTQIVYFGQVLSSTVDGILVCYYGLANGDGIKPIPYENDDGVDWYYLGLNANNSCTLTEYGTSASGGTVEAEPIVKITMTNIDCRILDNDPQRLRDITVYCTKERWDNFVALANSSFSISITYQNFPTVYPQLTREQQGFVFGYLLMDYFDGKVLPNSVLTNKVDTPLADYGQAFELPFSIAITMKNTNTGNIELVTDGGWGFGNDSETFPNGESVSGTYTTANTVITVEEIAGASIGAIGSGSSADTLKNYKELLTFYDQNGDKICGINKILSLKTKEWYYGVLNNGIQSAASMLGLTIPTVTDDNTAQSGINTILGAMQQAGVSSNIPNLILNFVYDYDFVIKQSVSNAGTEVYPLFVTGDISAYIMEAGSFNDLLTKFDFTGAYTVGYSLMEVNVTD